MFTQLAESSGARCGSFKTLHGEVNTPAFMPVGTQAAIRSMPPLFLDGLGTQIILANTYHLVGVLHELVRQLKRTEQAIIAPLFSTDSVRTR